MYCRGVRGATTITQDDAETVLQATRELMAFMIRLNDIDTQDVASAIFTVTSDITSVFPAAAARQLGWLDVPLLCGREMEMDNGLPLCIRILMHWNTDKSQKDIQHIYLNEAQSLRPDKAFVLSEKDIADLNNWIDQQVAIWKEK